MLIYKIFRADEWAELQAAGVTNGAPVDVADGFVHFSTAEQVAETAAKHFAGQDGLILLETNTQPGMTPTSLAPEQAAHCGMSFGQLCAWMVEDASCGR